MSSLPFTTPLVNGVKNTDPEKTYLDTSSPSTHEHNPILESALDRKTRLATRATSHQPSETSDATLLGALNDGGTFDNASSVTLQDELPRREVGADKSTQRIPSTIVPALLREIAAVSPSLSRPSLDAHEGPECDEILCDVGDAVSRYSAGQKGKWRAGTGDEAVVRDDSVRSPSPQFCFYGLHNSVEDWVVHNRPLLQEYADRQTSLPLGRRLEVSIDEPPRFILGAIQLLVNRDKKGHTDHSRRLGPQLIENFVDIDLWAKEYFRYRHSTRIVDSDVSSLLTIVINNFYEGQVQLIDRLVEFALENMRVCGRRSLGVEDFAFGFDFRMSQDLPFYVETSSRIREQALPIPAVEVQPISEPVTTSFGRQVKLTERAQAASGQIHPSTKGRRNKGKDASDASCEEISKGVLTPAGQITISTPSFSFCQSTETTTNLQAKPNAKFPLPPKKTSDRMKRRPARPSNLGLPPILPRLSTTFEAAALPSDKSSELEPSSSASSAIPHDSDSSGRSNLTIDPPFRFKIILPPSSLSATSVPVANNCESNSTKINDPPSQVNPPADVAETSNRRSVGLRSRGTRPRGPHNSQGPGFERGSASLSPNEVTPEATADNTESLPTENPVDMGDTEAAAAASKPLTAPLRPVRMLRNVLGKAPREAASSGTCGGGPSTCKSAHPTQLLPANDPGHPRRKKRKLDDCEDQER